MAIRCTQYSQALDCTAPTPSLTWVNFTVTRGQDRLLGWTVVLAALNGSVRVAVDHAKLVPSMTGGGNLVGPLTCWNFVPVQA